MSASSRPSVFFDPHGRRGRRVRRAATGLALGASVLLSAFAVSLVAVPALPQTVRHHDTGLLASLTNPPTHPGGTSESRALRRAIQAANHPTPDRHSGDGTIAAGFYAPWQDAGLASFRAHAPQLTHVIPAWLRLDTSGTKLDLRDFDLKTNPRNREVLDIARQNGVRVVPLLSNANGDDFAGDRVHKLLSDPAAQGKLAESLRDFLVQNGAQGLNVDFEAVEPADADRFAGFLKLLKTTFQPAHLELSADVEASWSPRMVATVAAPVDWVMLMAYDEHSANSEAGPIAGLDWADSVLDAALKDVPERKVVLGMGGYAYDWVRGKADADDMSYQEAIALAAGYRDEDSPREVIQLDPNSLNSRFAYEDDDKRVHDVWMLDATSAYNQWRSARGRGLRGAGLWVLGAEDPGIWNFFQRDRLFGPMSPQPLESIHIPYAVTEMGRGEILSVAERPSEGKRSFQVEKGSGLIVDQTYERYPSPYVLRHAGYQPKKLALTFDDGPDPTYTPQVLDELKQLHAPGTFFVVGENVEANPGLTRRIYDEGNEVGSHTFTHPNMGAVDDTRARLEINATQRAIQSTLGHSTILFRPPFNADSEPGSVEEVRPVELSDRLGYVTVGEKIDPQDWNLVVDGHEKTADEIADDVIREVTANTAHDVDGNMILLHDAGGDRSRTVAALPKIINTLRAKGYEFVSVSSLMGRDRDGVMPAIAPAERLKVAIAEIVFDTGFTASRLLAWGFLTAIGLGLLRIAMMAPLAWIHDRRRRAVPADPSYRPALSVLIAAYNEQAVIAATVRSVLASEYPVSDVVVIDDGSSDGTYEVVAETFAAEPRVRVFRQENGGKAAALNNALARTESEIVVCIDADTQIEAAAIGHLLQPFADAKIGAVAGNVEVGNADNIVTNWQRVEYTTSQNLDRRALALLNGVSVVPGAIGAWRRAAVAKVGGFAADTLAEDMDLTWRVRRAGYRIETEAKAVAFTEAPDTLRTLFRQRFRWTYGTLQCLWKHRRALGKYGFFGRVTLPSLWVFQVVFQCLGPLVDLQILICLAGYAFAWNDARLHPGAEMSGLTIASDSLLRAGVLYGILFTAELAGGLVAYRLAGQRARALGWLFLQRLVYRQIMYAVVLKSLATALIGGRQGWGKLKRKGNVTLPTTP